MATRWFAPLHHVFHDLGATTPNLSSPSTEYVNPIRTTPHSPPIPHPISVRRGRACRPCHDLRACSALSLPNSNPARALGGWVLRLTVNQQTDLVQVRGSQASSPRRRRQQVPVARTHTSRQARVEQLCCALVARREPCEGLRAAEAGRRKGGRRADATGRRPPRRACPPVRQSASNPPHAAWAVTTRVPRYCGTGAGSMSLSTIFSKHAVDTAASSSEFRGGSSCLH